MGNNTSNQQLINAVESGNLRQIKRYVKQGADIQADNDWAIRCASPRGHLNVVKYLVEQGANIHAQNDYAFRWASQNGHLEVVQYLKSLGCGKYNYPKKPEGFKFRNNEEYPITQEKIGCSKCKNVFSKEALENCFNNYGIKMSITV